MLTDWEQLPADHLWEDIFPALSIDTQVYYQCNKCNEELRLNPTLNEGFAQRYEGADCPLCSGGSLALVIHRLTQELLCQSCQHRWTIVRNRPMRVACPACGSSDLSSKDRVIPPMPRRFYDFEVAMEGGTHIWGKDGDADIDLLESELRITRLVISMTKSINYLVPIIIYARRLHRESSYDPSRSWLLLNFAGVLLRDLYGDTGDLSAGFEAFNTFCRCVGSISSPLELAMVQHNIAMTAFSLLAKMQPEFYMSGLHEKFRQAGIDAARAALRIYHDDKTPDTRYVRIQIARVNYILADLTWVGRNDKAALAEAIKLYDLTIADPALPTELRDHAQSARTAAIIGAADLPAAVDAGLDERLASFGQSAKFPPGQRVTVLLRLASAHEARGDTEAAISLLQIAVSIAEEQIFTAADELTAERVAETYHQPFYALARIQATQGAQRAALGSIESIRALPVRFARETQEERRRRVSEAVRVGLRWHLQLPDRAPEGSETRAVERLDRALNDLTRSGWPDDTAIWVISMSAGVIDNYIVFHDESTGWEVDSVQVRSKNDFVKLWTAYDPRPGVFRERQLASAVEALGRLMTEAIVSRLRRLAVRRVAISAPGQLAYLPYEAMPVASGRFGDEFEVFYLPSIVLGAFLSPSLENLPGNRVLAVQYGGSDLPMVVSEIDHMRHLWGSRLDVLDGSRVTKLDVLDSLTGDYALVHFSCHGSFDVSNPSRSSLYLDTDRRLDSKRITARELLSRRFQRNPIVTLSACSSALTSFGAASSCTGLTGSLLRMGARGVIGSRWAVYDGVAQQFVSTIYDHISEGVPAQEAVARTQRLMSARSGIEDWTAFSYLGTL